MDWGSLGLGVRVLGVATPLWVVLRGRTGVQTSSRIPVLSNIIQVDYGDLRGTLEPWVWRCALWGLPSLLLQTATKSLRIEWSGLWSPPSPLLLTSFAKCTGVCVSNVGQANVNKDWNDGLDTAAVLISSNLNGFVCLRSSSDLQRGELTLSPQT